MPMVTRCLDLRDDIDADHRNPSGERVWYITGIEPGQTLDDVIAKVIQDSDTYLTFRVPNSDGFTPAALAGRIHRKAIKPAWISHNQATAIVKYGLVDAAPHPDIGGQNPSKNSDDGGPASDEILGPEYSFSTTGGVQHITQLDDTPAPYKKMLRRYARKNTVAVEAAPNLEGAIGVARDRVEGVDKQVGGLEWSITIKGVPVTRNYLDYLSSVSWCLNLTRIFNADPEELLFTGAVPNFRPGEGWVVTYNFRQGKNRTNVKIGNVSGLSVAAFDHVWCTYEDSEDAGGGLQKPSAIYVDRIYELAELGGLFEAVP